MVVTVAAGVPIIQALTGAGAGTVIGAALTPGIVPPGKIRPGQFLQAALDIQALSEVRPEARARVSQDPFTGGFVISTESQAPVLFDILQEREIARQLKPSAALISKTRELRDIVIQEGRAVATSDLRLRQLVSSVPVSTRATARLVGPGAVGRGNVPSAQAESRRIRERAGPCAGPQTGFSRLRCAQGGFT